MQEREEIFHARLEQLEAGASLESCLHGLNGEDAAALRLIATMQAAAFPEQDPAAITAYRDRVLHKASQNKPTAAAQPANSLGTRLRHLQGQLDWLLTRRLVVGAVMALFIGACLLLSSIVAIRLAVRGVSPELAAISGETPGDKTAVTRVSPVGTPLPENIIPRETIVAAFPHEVFIPAITQPIIANPQTAVIQNVRGRVEVQAADGVWSPVLSTDQLTSGQRIRSGDLSSAIIAYFDGSQTILGANSELTLDELNAQLPENGFRTIIMTQVAGESEHYVAFRNDGGSRYQVQTAAGQGVARGTNFHVLVTPDLRARFTVNEGRVDVTNLSRTVSVLAGQMTQAMAGRTPTAPAFRTSGEGEVSQMGATWIIAGQSFQTDANTLISGSPQMGDLVYVEGHLSPDGVRLADRIILLQPSLNNQFRLMGQVETIGDTAWTVAGQSIVVNNETQIEPDIVVGDAVRVEGRVLPGGVLLAEQIYRLDGPNGYPFQFSGLVQQIGNTTWLISGQTITVAEETQIEAGIAVGDVVLVRGRILPDGTWLAASIRRVSQTIPEFNLTGTVQSMTPWNVAGISFETRDWTVIEPGINVGDRVRVRGIIWTDGTWVAVSIESLENPPLNVIVLIGIVTGSNPWSINGLPLVVTNSTIIGSGITVGQLVIVHIQLQANGDWVAISIQPLRPLFGLGCLIISSSVTQISGNQIIVANWGPLVIDNDLEIQGDLQPNSIILFPICTWPDGTIIIINIIVIYQPIIIVVPSPGGNGNSNDNGNGNHNGNSNGNDND